MRNPPEQTIVSEMVGSASASPTLQGNACVDCDMEKGAGEMRMAMVLLTVALLTIVATAEEAYVVETEFVRWAIADTGQTHALLQKPDEKSLIAEGQPIPFCSIRIGESVYPVTKAVKEGENLHVSFGECGVEAILNIETKPQYFIVTVVSLSDVDAVDEMTVLYIPLVLKGILEEPFTACALALNLQTNVREIPGPSKILKASAYKRFGIPGASVAVVAAPTSMLREVMKTVGNLGERPTASS